MPSKFLLFAICLFTINVHARTYTYPVVNPFFSIMFPDTWAVEISDNILHAAPGDGSIYMGIWEVPDDINLEDAGGAVGDIISDMVENAEFGSPVPSDNNGISFLNMNGTGKEKDSGNPVNVSVSFFTRNNYSVYILLYFGSPESELKNQFELTDIVKSIQTI